MGTLLSYSGLLTVLVNKGEHSKACSEAYLSFFFFLIFLLIFFLLSKWKPTILAECFAESAYLEPKWGNSCACSKLHLLAGWRHILSKVVLVAKPQWKNLPGWGLFTPLRWAGDTISLGFFEERAVLQPGSMNWSFSKARPEFERIWASKWVLVKTNSDFDPNQWNFLILSTFWGFSEARKSGVVRTHKLSAGACVSSKS